MLKVLRTTIVILCIKNWEDEILYTLPMSNLALIVLDIVNFKLQREILWVLHKHQRPPSNVDILTNTKIVVLGQYI